MYQTLRCHNAHRIVKLFYLGTDFHKRVIAQIFRFAEQILRGVAHQFSENSAEARRRVKVRSRVAPDAFPRAAVVAEFRIEERNFGKIPKTHFPAVLRRAGTKNFVNIFRHDRFLKVIRKTSCI